MAGTNRHALVSVVVAGALCLVAVMRLLSYSRLGAWIEESVLGGVAYRPESFGSVRYFKILATPAFVSLIYFAFRIMNRASSGAHPTGYQPSYREIDFSSVGVRLGILAVINLHWVVLEGYKFYTREFPYSPLESWVSNAVVLAVGSVISFFGMKYLSFAPVRGSTQ